MAETIINVDGNTSGGGNSSRKDARTQRVNDTQLNGEDSQQAPPNIDRKEEMRTLFVRLHNNQMDLGEEFQHSARNNRHEDVVD